MERSRGGFDATENVGVAVVVCMRDSYFNPTAVGSSLSSVSVDTGTKFHLHELHCLLV